ncbi:hypothetical protein [Bradyrhizobium sp. CSA207]|uniref:hypothetical protein n=1 Tax=Bradyrhizobium sp. CSA207 TaxID=2698826 RepID=UPI003183A902
MSGVYSDPTAPGSVWAAKKAIEDFNLRSEGMKVEMIFADHQNKPDFATNSRVSGTTSSHHGSRKRGIPAPETVFC